MLISTAYAQTATSAAAGPASGIETFLPIILVFVVFYFLLIRPQGKRAKQHKELLAGLRRGDRVVTGGGLIGTIAKVVNDGEVVVEIAEGVRVRVMRGTIQEVLGKTEPVAAKSSGDKTAES
jgi:preprotein translocase subunit YajC